MDVFNSIINLIFNALFFPFKSIDPVWGMIVISFITGIVMLLIFKATSDQTGIKQAKNKVKAHFLAIRLYRDDISLMFETMGNIIASNLGYMKKSLRPMLFLILPVAVIIIQLGTRYEYRPLHVGESTVISLRLHNNASLDDLRKVELHLPTGLKVATPPVRIEQLREVSWRIEAVTAGKYDVIFKFGEHAISKTVQVDDVFGKVTPKVGNDFATTLMNPGEPSLAGSAFGASVGLHYPKREFSLFGLGLHWLVAFFVLSLIFGFAFKSFLGVEL